MSLKYALLGFLEFCPRSGYDLKKEFDSSVAHFWPAQHSQIYGTLARLTNDGLATVEVHPQQSRPDRKVYHITDAGRVELREWLAKAQPTMGGKSGFQVQLFFLGLLEDEQALSLLRERIACIQSTIDRLKRMIPDDVETPGDAQHRRYGFFTHLTLDYGIRHLQFLASWLREVVGKIERGESARGSRAALERTDQADTKE